MAIPRFNAQITQIQVPSMKNYQEEQNNSITKSLADFGSGVFEISMRLKMAQMMGSKADLQEATNILRKTYQNKNSTPEQIKYAEDLFVKYGGDLSVLGEENG